MIGNSKSQKIKEKMKTHYSVKKKITGMAAFKMIVQQRVDKKLQLEKQKTGPMNSLAAEILQLYKMYKEIIEI